MHPTYLEPVLFFWSCAEGKVKRPITEWKQRLSGVATATTTTATATTTSSINTPLSGQISLQHKARKAFPCAILFQWKNRQCPIFATSSPPYFVLDKTLFWKNKYKKQQQKKCLQVYIVQCCICITPSQSTDLDCELFWQIVLTMSLFFFLRKESRFDQADEGWEELCRVSEVKR